MLTRVRLFGGFRKYIGTATHIEFEQNEELSVSEIKSCIAAELKRVNSGFADDNLIADSALANEDTIFSQDDRVLPGRELALLPPVCGG